MATKIISQDIEETPSQALSWETCSQSSWSLTCESYRQLESSAHRDSGFGNYDISKIFSAPNPRHSNKRNASHRNLEPEAEETGLFLSSRYIQGRPPLREDGNPKGKHPRKSLPSWRLNKLKRISNREGVAEDYRELIWHEQREEQRQEHKLAKGETPDNQGHRVFTGVRPSPANMKKKTAKMTRRRKNERKRVNRTIHDGESSPKPPANNARPPVTIPLNREIEKRKKWMEGYIKPHYFTLFDALAKQKGHAEYAWGCDYCEERLRDLKTTRFKNWKSQALINGVKDVEEHDHLEEMARNEIEKCKLEDQGSWREDVSMDEIVSWREEPGYVVRYQPGKKKGGGKKKVVARKEVAAGDILDLPVKGRNEAGSEDEWEDLEWDKSDDTGSVWV